MSSEQFFGACDVGQSGGEQDEVEEVGVRSDGESGRGNRPILQWKGLVNGQTTYLICPENNFFLMKVIFFYAPRFGELPVLKDTLSRVKSSTLTRGCKGKRVGLKGTESAI